MNKFAYIAHLPNGYRQDFSHLHHPLGILPDFIYKAFMYSLPLPPYVYSEVRVSPIASEPDGYIIMLPYTGKQLIEQQWLVQPIIEKAVKLAAEKGASIVGLGPLFSSITMRGRLLANNPYVKITNGSTLTAINIFQKIEQLLQEKQPNPHIAIVGATGSVGTLVSQLLANAQITNCHFIARDNRRLTHLSNVLDLSFNGYKHTVSTDITNIRNADIVVMLSSSSEKLLKSKLLKKGVTILDATHPRCITKSLVRSREDIQLLDAGLVSAPSLHFSHPDIALPNGISYSSLAETILLAQAGCNSDFGLGKSTLTETNLMLSLCEEHRRLGFTLAPDHSFGKPIIPEQTRLPETTYTQPAFKLA
jgi:fatty aldehyde-generating acyl-ACP reductase